MYLQRSLIDRGRCAFALLNVLVLYTLTCLLYHKCQRIVERLVYAADPDSPERGAASASAGRSRTVSRLKLVIVSGA